MLGFLFKKKPQEKEEIETIKEKVIEENLSPPTIDKSYPNIGMRKLPQSLPPLPEQSEKKEAKVIENEQKIEPKNMGEKDQTQKSLESNERSLDKNIPNEIPSGETTNKNIEDLFSPTSLQNPSEKPKEPEENTKDINLSAENKENEVVSGNDAYINTLIKNKIVSPPLFISVSKYKEIVNELLSLKVSITALESVLNMSKKISEEEKAQVKDLVGELEKVNSKIKYFGEVFRLKK